MTIDDFLTQDCEWLKGTGTKSNIAMSSRMRLARNLEKLPFSHWADEVQQEVILTTIWDAARSLILLKGALFIRIVDLNDVDKLFLIERHLMSPEHAKDSRYKALIVDPKEVVSIMINEEDHLRIQVLQSGLNLASAWQMINELDTELSRKLALAYSAKWGYLTACPTNTGTGLRGSVMLHLPAMTFSGQIGKVLQAAAKLGLNIRGLYGEGTEASGNIFQVSNQVSMGRAEEDIVDGLEKIVNQIIAREEAARKTLSAKNREELSDKVWRALGTLKSARIITSNETITLLSAIRLGVDLGIVKNLDRRVVNELLILTQPAHLQKSHGKVLSSTERDMKRAELIREKLK